MSSLLKDVNGNASSKRVAGYVLMGLALIGGLVSAIIGNTMLMDFCKWIIVTGGAAVVAGVVERRS